VSSWQISKADEIVKSIGKAMGNILAEQNVVYGQCSKSKDEAIHCQFCNWRICFEMVENCNSLHPKPKSNFSTRSTVEGIMNHLGPIPTVLSDRKGSAHENINSNVGDPHILSNYGATMRGMECYELREMNYAIWVIRY